VEERGGRIDAMSQRLGAANTLVVGSAGGIACANTDAPAAVEALCEGLNIKRDELNTRRVAVIGAGGVARAVAAGLLDAGATVVVFSRSAQRAHALVDRLKESFSPIESRIAVGKADALACGCFHVFINCTPVGMSGGPAPDGSPLPDDVRLTDEVAVMDTVYAPVRTPLITEAESRGARVITGVDMFLRQAALQFEMWTASTAPMTVFQQAMR
jgi:shikimate dehydrogenase